MKPLPFRALTAGVIGSCSVIVSGEAPRPPSFPSQVERVMVDVVVTDKAGHPVADRTAADFAVTEEGRPQRIVSFDAVLRRSLDSLAALYFVDVRGLVGFFQTENAGGPIALAEEAGGADRLATETGGFAIHGTNDLGRGLVRVAAEGRVYYILGCVPSGQAKPGSYRRIEVRVRRPGLKVRARPGYVR